MSTLINGETWNGSVTLTKRDNTKITLVTDSKYVSKDIELTVNAQSASPSFDGGALNNKGASATFTNATTSNSNSSGIVILAKGTAGREPVLYNGAVNGWVNAADNTQASAAISSSTWNGTTYYLTGVTLTNSKSFNITVPEGQSTHTYTISVDSEGNVSGLGSGSVITFWDEEDTHGGLIRHIEAISLAGDTDTPSALAQGVTAHNALGQAIVGTGGGGSIELQEKTNINPTTSSQTITADSGYDGLSSVQINAMPSGSVTSPAAISGTSASLTTGTNTLTLSKTISVTPQVTTAGYVASGTAGNSAVSLTASVTTKAAATITPTTTNQTIASGTYLTGTQTIKGDSNLVAANIKKGVTIFNVAGSYEPAGISLQTKTGITPTEESQTITADSGYDGLSSVQINAISSTYVGSGITTRDSNSLTLSGATVTAPAGYYASAASKNVAIMTLPTSAASSATSGYTSKATISRSTSAQYINIPTGYNITASYYTISATPNGSVTAPSSISGTTATVSTGTNTLTLTKTVSVTPNVTTAGYISSGTAGNSSVSLTASVTTKAAATITPSTSNQTIASGTYLTGTQTIAGDANLVGSNILSGKSIFGVAGTVTFQTYYTGSSAPSSSTGVNGDIYLQT